MTGPELVKEVKALLYNKRPGNTEFLVALRELSALVTSLMRITENAIEVDDDWDDEECECEDGP
jgi:hypothetical protein